MKSSVGVSQGSATTADPDAGTASKNSVPPQLRSYAELVGVAVYSLPGTPRHKLAALIGAPLVVTLVVVVLWLSTGKAHWLLLLGIFPLCAGIWVAVVKYQRHQYEQECADALPDYLLLIAAGLKAGQTIEQAMTAAIAAKGPLAAEFARTQALVRMGEPTPAALTAMSQRINNKDLGWVAIAITINARLGGDLAALLQTLSHTLRERQVLRRTARSLSAEGRISAWVLGGLPVGFLVLMAVLAPSHIQALFGQVRGLVLVAVATALMILGALWLKRAVHLEV